MIINLFQECLLRSTYYWLCPSSLLLTPVFHPSADVVFLLQVTAFDILYHTVSFNNFREFTELLDADQSDNPL